MKSIRVFLLIIIDIILINIAIYGALLIRFDGDIPDLFMQGYYDVAIIFTIIRLVCYYLFGLYHRLWQYASIGELMSVVLAVSLGSILNVFVAYFFIGQPGTFVLPRSVYIISWGLNIFLIGGSRLFWRLLRDYTFPSNRTSINNKPILIYGAGNAGVIIAKELRSQYNGDSKLVGFIDDNPQKKNALLLGYQVLGNREDLPRIKETFQVKDIILAMPSEEGKVIKEVVEYCQELGLSVKILPGMYDLIEGNITLNQIREVKIEDLLGRDPVKVDLEGICDYIQDKVVLVTGAGGSIGSELCRQIIQYNPRTLLLFDHCENNVYEIEMELRNGYLTQYDGDYAESSHDVLIPIVKDVRDWNAVKNVFEAYIPEVIFHAAAHKHVPLMEANPEEAIKNNVLGTYHVAKAADIFQAKKFVLVSTDKAVNPTSVMGASKRVAEMVIQHMDKYSETSFVAVRFGNVLGSRGSVVPLFKKQIAAGGPVTVTHKDMIRYFMTIPESVQLIIQAGAMAKGGEIFVLDMGEPVKIVDLAKTMIKLSGFEPYRDIDISITGMRPGEKLYEELLSAEEGVNATFHKRIYVAKPNGLNTRLIEDTMRNFDLNKLPINSAETIYLLQSFIPSFRRQVNISEATEIHCSIEKHEVMI